MPYERKLEKKRFSRWVLSILASIPSKNDFWTFLRPFCVKTFHCTTVWRSSDVFVGIANQRTVSKPLFFQIRLSQEFIGFIVQFILSTLPAFTSILNYLLVLILHFFCLQTHLDRFICKQFHLVKKICECYFLLLLILLLLLSFLNEDFTSVSGLHNQYEYDYRLPRKVFVFWKTFNTIDLSPYFGQDESHDG